MLFGEGNRQVFGSNYGESRYAVRVIRADAEENRVLLEVGKAQGMGEGARFAIYPPGTTDFTAEDKQIAIAKVSSDISPTHAWAEIEADSLLEGTDIETAIESASVAVMLSAPIALVRQISLFEKQKDDGTGKLPSNQVLPAEVIKIQGDRLKPPY